MTTETETQIETVHWTQSCRTMVRPLVTVLVIFAYVTITWYAIWYLLVEGQTDNALALLAGISGIATGIVGYWFGTRGKGGLKLEENASGGQPPTNQNPE